MMNSDRLSRFIDGVLAFIVIVAAVVLLYGGALFIWEHGRDVPDYHIFRGVPKEKVGIANFAEAFRDRDSIGVMECGLFLLLVVPFLRVFSFIWYYWIERQYLYACFSLFSFIVLIFSMF